MQFHDLARLRPPKSGSKSGCRTGGFPAVGFVAVMLCVLAALPGPANAARRASMVMDGNTGRVLHASQPDRLCYPASLTKMMTLFILFDELKKGRLKFGSRIRISKRAARVQPSKLGLKPGKTISVRNAIKALITKSANDVAIAVAEKISGSEAAFARRMTRRARQLGMRKTRFTNASGLPDTDQVTTPRDILKLATALMDVHKKHYHLFAMRSFTYQGRVYKNHNGLLRNFRGTDGLKTGYTRASGFNLVASTRRGGKHVIGAVFGGKNTTERNRKMRSLLTQAFKRASKVKTRKPLGRAQRQLVAGSNSQPANRRRLRTWPVAAPRPAARPARRAARLRQVLPRPARQLRQVRQARPARPAVVAAATSASTAPITIARVRPVRFANAAGQRAELRTTPQRLGIAAVARQPSTFDAQAARLARGPAAQDGAAPPSAPALDRPQHRPQQWRRTVAGFGAPTAMRAAMLGVRPESPSPAQTSGARALPGAGGGQVGSGQGAGGQEVRAVPPAGGKFHVQIGAYGSEGEARQRIEDVQILAGSLLNGYTSVTIPYQKANKQYYRARFAGFDSGRASATCNELRRRQIDCFVAKGR